MRLQETLGWMLVATIALTAGCATPYVKAQKAYYAGDAPTAEEVLAPVAEKEIAKDGRMKNVYLWDLGIYQFSQEKYEEAARTFRESVLDKEHINSAGEDVRAAATSSARAKYVGDPVEVSLAYLFVGICYTMLDDQENALVAYRRSIEEDLSDELDKVGNMGVTNFLMGETFARAGRMDDAKVAYQRSVQFVDGFAPGWIGLYYSNLALGKQGEAKSALDELAALTSAEFAESVRDSDGSGVTPIVFSGVASIVKADAFLGAFRQRSERSDNAKRWEMVVDGETGGPLHLSDRMHEHLTSQGGFGDEAKQQGTRLAVGMAMQQVPCVGAFAPSTDADLRWWTTMPGYVWVGWAPLAPGTYEVSLNATDKRGRRLGAVSQTWTGVTVPPGKRALLPVSAYRGKGTHVYPLSD